MKRTMLGITLVGIVLMLVWPGPSAAPVAAPSPAEVQLREEAFARARVFNTESIDIGTIDFARDPNAPVIDPHLTTCRFLPTAPTGTTPKFDCALETREKIKVKYGWTREIPAEVAATRLLDGLGFGADRMSHVDVLRCFGCVVSPFHVRSLARMVHLAAPFDRHLNYDHSIDFVNVAVERKMEGHALEAGTRKGWTFDELSKIDPARGGATRDEIDALRLMAMFLNHWDNKSDNQRLVCLTDDCDHPIAMIQDTGSDFGPYKLSLSGWSKSPIWTDARSCLVSMKALPYNGATFQDVRISEGGRRLLADRLQPLTRVQIRTLFVSAGFKDVDRWVDAFENKVNQIATTRCVGS